MTRAVCPGSFDPPTLGHLDIFARASAMFDQVTVAVLVNPGKNGLFSIPDRLELLRAVTSPWPNIRIDSFSGLLVEYCAAGGITTIVKGLRGVSDFDYEIQMAQMNRSLTGVDTLFLPTAPQHAFVSSSLVKQVASYGGDVSAFLPPVVLAAVQATVAPRDR